VLASGNLGGYPNGTVALSASLSLQLGIRAETHSGRCCGIKHHHLRPILQQSSAFGGFRFPPEVIPLAVRWKPTTAA